MRGTDNAAPSATALSRLTWTDQRAGFLDASILGVASGGVSPADIATAIVASLAASPIPADLVAIGGDAAAAAGLVDFASVGYDRATHKVAGVGLVDATTTNLDMRGTDDAATSTALTAAVSTIGSGLGGVLADTGALRSDWAAGGRLDLVLAAIAAAGPAEGGGPVIVAGYAAGQSPSELVLADPARRLLLDEAGRTTGAADLLAAVSGDLTGVPGNFPERLMWLFYHSWSSSRDRTSGIWSTKGSDGSVVTDQASTSTEAIQAVFAGRTP
jgi:hypothetical protein